MYNHKTYCQVNPEIFVVRHASTPPDPFTPILVRLVIGANYPVIVVAILKNGGAQAELFKE